MKRLLAAFISLALTLAPAFAGTGTITVKDSAGATQTFAIITNGSSQFIAEHVICDGVAAAQCAAVKAASTAAAQTDPALVVRNPDLVTGLADAACATDNGTCTIGQLLKRTNQNLTTQTAAISASIPAGTNVIGHVIVDTAPSTAVTNAGTFAVQAALNAGTNRTGYVSDDPCTQLTKTNLAIATASGTTQLVAPSGSTQVYVCSLSLISAATAVVNLVGGTGATCTTGTPVAAIGSTTAASGMSLAANGGLTFGNGGATAVRTTTAGHGLCLIQSGTTALAGNIEYVQQ